MHKFQGLSHKEAKEKLKEYGLNEISENHKVSSLKILFRQIKSNVVLYLLVFTAITSFLLGKELTGIVILIVVLIVVVTGFIQEYKAEKAISELRKMIMPISRVIRDNKEREIPSNEIVPGDIIILRTGEKVPADCIILSESNLKINESILTGESIDIHKKPTESASSYTDVNQVFMGSFVVGGRCIAQVIHTGMNTKFGEIAGMISTADKKLPLQDKVNKISKYMVAVGLTAAFLTGFVLFNRADSLTPEVVIGILITVIAIAVSSFPEGFPVVFISTLAGGVKRMAKQNAVVNRMSIIETLGETSVICSDKTGTITKGEMTIKKLYIDGKHYEVSGVGYETKGYITLGNEKLELGKNNILDKLIECAVVCNDSNIEELGDELNYKVIGSSTEGALLILAAKLGIFRENYPNRRIEEIPFDSQRKMMSVLYEDEMEKNVYAKGAPEVVLSKCKQILTKDGIKVLTHKELEKILSENQKLTSNAFRSLALAYKTSEKDQYTEEDFIFLGLISMDDPPREEVAQAISLCKQSGIKVKMITGDNKETAIAVARQIGIEGGILTGNELDALSDDELTKEVLNTVIFARVKPEDKLRIIKALKANNEIVTMTGDGVNDAPALKEAHIGVAMGINGTDVSRSVADITLKDDNFATIVAAIKEGRTIFNNIRKFVTYQLSCNLADIYILFIGMIVAPALGWFVPIITALQILFMNIVTDNMPAITLGFNSKSKDVMSERPRNNAQILTNEFLNVILLNGITMGIIAFCVSFVSYNIIQFPPEVARTTVLVSMIMVQVANAYNFRSFRYRVLNRGLWVNKYLFIASIFSILATIVIVYVPAFNKSFDTTPLGFQSWIIAAIAAFIIVLFFDILKVINNRTGLLLTQIH